MKYELKKKYLKEVCDGCSQKDEAVFAILATHKKGDYFAVGDMDLVHRGIYEILAKGIAGEEDSPNTKVAWAILEALRDLQDEGADIEGLLTAFNEDEDDDCDTCELLKVCGNERAIKWRKALGIPRPKKGRKIEIN